MSKIVGTVVAAGLMFAGASGADATVFSGTVSYTNGSGPSFSTNSPASFSADLSSGQTQTFTNALSFSTSTSGAGLGTLTFSFDSPTTQAASFSAGTFASFPTLTSPPTCFGSGSSQTCFPGSSTTTGTGFVSFPSPTATVIFADGSKAQLSVSEVTVSGGSTASGALSFTLTNLAAAVTAVPEPATLALLTVSCGVLGALRSRRPA